MRSNKIPRKLNVATVLNIGQFINYPVIMKINYQQKENRFLFSNYDEVAALLQDYPIGAQVYLHHFTGNAGFKNLINATEWLAGAA